LPEALFLSNSDLLDVQDAQTLQDKQGLIQTQRWLSDKKNMRWLLIFDNYDDPDQFQIEQYYLYVSHATIIVTTRGRGGIKDPYAAPPENGKNRQILGNSISAKEY
jgi:hypothetical protein